MDNTFHPSFLQNTTPIERVAAYRRLVKKYSKGSHYDIGGIKLPKLATQEEWEFFSIVFWETIAPCLFFENHFYDSLYEDYPGVYYGLERPDFEVVVRNGDIVFDAGSWIGDFAAYASKCGAGTVYAFEPVPETYEILAETSRLNPNITAVKKGLGNTKGCLQMFRQEDWTSGDTLLRPPDFGQANIAQVEITTVDDFVRENNIPRVDFIKSDIEGFERNMLEGASMVLREFAPKLAICAYHLPDDPEVLERIILDANPAYRIVHKPKILFARV
jgi:FkbM family methyltransferase